MCPPWPGRSTVRFELPVPASPTALPLVPSLLPPLPPDAVCVKLSVPLVVPLTMGDVRLTLMPAPPLAPWMP